MRTNPANGTNRKELADEGQEVELSILKGAVYDLIQIMVQMTAGQEKYRKKNDISFDDLEAILNIIVMESMCLVISGAIDEIEAEPPSDDVQKVLNKLTLQKEIFEKGYKKWK